MIAPLTVCGAPTAGKAILLALLEGNPCCFSTPLWHDNVSAALCNFVPLAQRVPKELAEGIYGNNLQLKYFRDLLSQTEYSRLEAISLQNFYIFHLSNSEQIKVPISFDFYSMDKYLAKTIWSMENYNAENIFSAIFYALYIYIVQKRKEDIRYALTMPFNDFSNYKQLLKTFPQGKIIYIDRNIADGLGSTILRRAKLCKTSFAAECRKEFLEGDKNFFLELVSRAANIQKLRNCYPDKLLVVKFDELILETEKTMKNICNWLSIPFTENMLHATFQGKIIDPRATGMIQDDIKKLISDEDNILLHKYISYFKNTKDNKWDIPASLFNTEHPFSDGNIVIEPRMIEHNIFYGPYIHIPHGKYEVMFNFEANNSLPHIQWTLDCIDTSGKCYFQKTLPISVINKTRFVLIVDNYKDIKFEFRAYGEMVNCDLPVIFKGLKISKIGDKNGVWWRKFSFLPIKNYFIKFISKINLSNYIKIL